MTEIEGIAKKFDVSDSNFRFKFIAAPWTSEDVKESKAFPDGQHIAFTHWRSAATSTQGRLAVLLGAQRRGARRRS